MRLISELINAIWRVLQKWLKYLSGSVILTVFIPSYPVEPVIFCLNLDKKLLPGKSSAAPASAKSSWSLWYCHKLPDVFE